MKRIIGILVTLVLLFTLVPVAQADGAPAIVSVIAPQIDNTVYEYGETVRVICENTEFTKSGVEVGIMYTAAEEVFNLRIIDDVTIEFDVKMFHAAVREYGISLRIPQEIGIPKTVITPPVLEVRRGQMMIEDNPTTSDHLHDEGLVIKFSHPDEGMQGDFTVDGVTVDHSKISDVVWRIYPDWETYAGKSQVEIRFIMQGDYLRKTLYLQDNEFWMEPPTISHSQPIEFTLNTLNLDFPDDGDDISLIVRGKGRYIDVKDIDVVSSKQIEVDIPYALVRGVYEMTLTWPGLGMAYKLPLEITKSTILSDIALDEAVDAAIYEKHNGFEFTVNDGIVEKYLASEKKTLDFTDRELGYFYLLIENSAVNTLADEGIDLMIEFGDATVTVPNDAMTLGKTKDLYILLEGGQTLDDVHVKYFEPVRGVHADTNLNWFRMAIPEPTNLYSFEAVELIHDYIDTGRAMLPASNSNEMLVFDVSATGVYQPVIEGMSFDDLADTYWGAEYIYPLSALGIIHGMGDGTYQSEGLVTNAQFVKLVCETIGLETSATLSYFADVDMNAWYYPYVCAMEKAGIIGGDYFQPNKPMDRLNMASVVVKAYAYYTGADIGAAADESDDTFLDIAMLSLEEQDYIKAAYSLGIIKGMSSTTFSPNGNATRSHAAAMTYRLLEAMMIIQ